ncbi:hypothetical protein AYO46_00915 [Betaproteobacteria bacterium SCGC AG-212-J23]|nr:hypothetical protein AYO46_00915 [Betaproteobacteria bacterium SCGC AG-212-J23]
MKLNREALLHAYEEEFALYEAFAAKTADLLVQLLQHAKIRIHAINPRAKTKSSFAQKISRPAAVYTCLDDVTDIAGVRVIAYFADDVDRIAEVIRREFEIDAANSVDKRALLDPDRFGYLSLHYVVSLTKRRAKLGEYSRFTGKRVEIQIRSVLQHSWAEIEHDLGYKAKVEVPAPIFRKFSRLAGLLELADEQFQKIRDELSAYAAKVPSQIQARPQDVPIDAITLVAFLGSNGLTPLLAEKIAQTQGRKVVKTPAKEAAGRCVSMLAFVGVRTISVLAKALKDHGDKILDLASSIYRIAPEDPRPTSPVEPATPVFYLGYVLLAKTGNADAVKKYLDEWQLGDPNTRMEFSMRLLNWFKTGDPNKS